MKKILAMLAILFNLIMISQATHANPRDHQRQTDRNVETNGDVVQEKRREREERGFKRLQQHKWQAGYVMPQHYRGDGYKVDYREQNLPKPARNQQWYKINNDYILVDSESNNIVQILNL